MADDNMLKKLNYELKLYIYLQERKKIFKP